MFKFGRGQHQRPDLAVDQAFGLLDISVEILRIDVADHHQVDDAAVFAVRVVAGDEGHFQVSQAGDHFIHDVVDDLVDAHVFVDERFQLRVKRVVDVGAVFDDVTLTVGDQVAGLGKVVELVPDGVGGFPELLRETAQVCLRVTVEKKLQQHLDAGP